MLRLRVSGAKSFVIVRHDALVFFVRIPLQTRLRSFVYCQRHGGSAGVFLFDAGA